MSDTAAEAAAVAERLRFARNMLRDARNTAALVHQARVDVMGTRGTHAEQRAHYVIEETLANRRVREWTDRVSTLESTAAFLGVEL